MRGTSDSGLRSAVLTGSFDPTEQLDKYALEICNGFCIGRSARSSV
jgi:hypothetical protein